MLPVVPDSPETQAYIKNYTPSRESQEDQEWYGRRRLRILNGQDPEEHPEMFTPPPPVVRVEDVWPTNEQAYQWAEPGRKKRALYNNRIREEAEKMKKLKLKTPSGAAGSSSTPITNETAAAASTSYAGPPVPIQSM